MRFHIPSIPHTVTSKEHSACAFTQNIVNFCAMMSRRGHEIIHYGHRNSVVECAELVPIVEPETYDMLYGNAHDIRNNQYVTHGDDHPLNALISGNTIYEISKRKRPGDYLLIFGGFWNKKIADAHGDMIVVEPAIGYPSSFTNFKVYPSYAYLHSFVQDANLPINHYHVVIPHYFDVDDFDPHQPKEDYFLFVGRLNFDKGITLAIDLTAKIGARLKVCGQGNLQALGYAQIPDHVDFIGYVGVEKRKELMAKAKCVIMPTIYMEPFGCVVIESLLSGTPILTHDWGGPGENNLHGVTGFKCRTFEQFEWAARNIHLIEPKKCREWAEKNFSFDKIGHMYEDYFQSLQGGVDWYRPNPSRTNLDHLKKEYPVSSKWCVVIFAYGDIFYALDSKRVLEDYFRFHGIPYYFITEKPLSFDTKEAHPSWWKLKVHSIVRGYDFIITWDLDLLPRNRHAKVIQEFDMTKICMVRDSSVSDTEDGFFKYNGGLIGIPKTYQSFMENIFDTHAPGVLADYEQYYLNNELFQNNMKIHELPRKLNGLYSTRYFPDALLQHYTHGHGAKYKISEHRQMYFQEYDTRIVPKHGDYDTRIDMIRSLVPKHGEYAEVGVFEGEFSKELFSVLEPRKLHLIDLFTGSAVSGDKDGNNGKCVNLDDVFQNLITYFPSNVLMYKGLSYNTLEVFDDDSLDMIYIDGDHEYEGVRKDLEMAYKKVKSGGWIMGHDYEMNMQKAQTMYTFGVKRAVDEFCKEQHQTIHAKAFDGCVSWAIHLTKPDLLTKLCEKYLADKCPKFGHSYSPLYNSILNSYRSKIKNVLEIGIGNIPLMSPIIGQEYKPGASLYVWREYFPNATINGCDILNQVLFEDDRIKTFFIDQSSRESLETLVQSTFDIIIDDGSHVPEHMKLSYEVLWPTISPGGFYIIEDIKGRELEEFVNLNPTECVFKHEGTWHWDSFVVFRKQY